MLGSLSAGFLYHTDGLQAGFLLTSGSYGWYRNTLSENEFPKDESDAFSVDGSTSWKSRYCEGPSAVLGVYFKVSPLIAFAIEGGYQLPLEYTDPIASRADKKIEYIDADKKLKDVYFAGGGLALTFSESLVCALGMQYLHYGLEMTQNNSYTKDKSEMSMQTFRITAGADWKVGESVHAIIYGAVGILKGTMESAQSNPNMNMGIDLKLTNTLYSVGIGVVQYF